jgi:hypothetical protein
MKNLFDEMDNLFYALLFVVCLILSGITIKTIIATHDVTYYFVSTDDNGDNIFIKANIDWCLDEKIPLDRNITLDQAIELVNKMNKTLNK